MNKLYRFELIERSDEVCLVDRDYVIDNAISFTSCPFFSIKLDFLFVEGNFLHSSVPSTSFFFIFFVTQFNIS